MAAARAGDAFPSRMPARSGRPLSSDGGGSGGETWKSDIVRQLKHRDRNQHVRFQDLVRFYTNLLEKTHLSSFSRCSSCNSYSSSSSHLLQEKTEELTYQVAKLQLQSQSKDKLLEKQRARLLGEEQRLAAASAARLQLERQVEQVGQDIRRLKMTYDSLREEFTLREKKVRIQSLNRAVARTSKDEEQRAPEANAHARFRRGGRHPPPSQAAGPEDDARSLSPKMDKQDKRVDSRVSRTSVMAARIFSPIRKLLQKPPVLVLHPEDQMLPAGCCPSARVPARGLQVPDAHEQGINAASFSCAELLATGGTDRLVKLWDIKAGSLTHRATLDDSTEGITCIHFSQTGHRLLAASYDGSVVLWPWGSATPKLTLTGHSRKVTAARFCTLPHQAATGSADRTIRHWDLHRAACVQQVPVTSYCSDLVCADHLIISGHYDSKVRIWDGRTLSCIQELPVQGRITSLDISSDHRKLLSCCRDNSLQLVDLRRWSKECMFFRADGFFCGSDSTKAVISPDGDFVAAGSASGSLFIWNVSTGKLETHLAGNHSSAINSVSWSPSGKYVISVDKSGMVVLWTDI